LRAELNSTVGDPILTRDVSDAFESDDGARAPLNGDRTMAPAAANGAPTTLREVREFLAVDYARHANRGALPRLVLAIVRLGQYLHVRGRRGPVRALWHLADIAVIQLILGAEIPPSVKIGPGFGIPHSLRGTVIHGDTQIGRHVMVFHRVTIGVNGESAPPVIQDDAVIGLGACVLGAIVLGTGARVCPMALVLRDVPEMGVAIGNPSRILRDFSDGPIDW
jgi:serine acetyltransferase